MKSAGAGGREIGGVLTPIHPAVTIPMIKMLIENVLIKREWDIFEFVLYPPILRHLRFEGHRVWPELRQLYALVVRLRVL